MTILGFQLLDQLVPGGRMVMPIGEPFKGQNLTIIDKLSDGYTIVTTVVRTVRTNPLYRDRFQQKKYYTELRWVFVCTPYNMLVMQSARFCNGGIGNKILSFGKKNPSMYFNIGTSTYIICIRGMCGGLDTKKSRGIELK